MSMKATAQVNSVSVSVAPLLRTATVTGTAVDLANVIENMFVFTCGANTDGTFTPKLTECATVAGTYTDVAAADLVGTALVAMAANTVQLISYIGKLEFIKPVVTVTGSPATGANVVVSAVVRKRKQP